MTLEEFIEAALAREDLTGLRLFRAVRLAKRPSAQLVADYAPKTSGVTASEIATDVDELVSKADKAARFELRAAFESAPTEPFRIGDWTLDLV